MHIGIIADDLTSAADGGAPFARAGHGVAVGFGQGALPAGDVDVLALDLDSRRGSPGEAAARVGRAAAVLGPLPLLYMTVDSTLRGHVGVQVAAALQASGRRIVVVAPAFPAGGRATVGGVQLVDGLPVHRTRFGQDLRNPVRQSRVARLFDGLGLGPAVELASTAFHEGAPLAGVQRGARVIVADAATDADLDALVMSMRGHDSVLWVGSPGLAHALARAHPGTRAPWDQPRATRPLVVVGSLHPSSRAQVAALVGARQARTVQPGVAGGIGRADAAGGGPSTVPLIVHSPCAVSDDPAAVAATLGHAVQQLVCECAVDGLIATGGDTALAAARALGAAGMSLWGEVEPGIPVGTLIGPHPFPVITKAGGFGDDGTLARLWDALRGPPSSPVQGMHA